MAKQYEVRDEAGRLVGTAEEIPSGADTAVGLAVIAVLIYRFRKPLGILLLVGLVVAGVIGLVNAVSNKVKYGTTDQQEIAAIRAADRVSDFRQRLIGMGTLSIDERIEYWDWGWVEVDRVEFKDSMLIVHFDAGVVDPNLRWTESCLRYWDESGYMHPHSPAWTDVQEEPAQIETSYTDINGRHSQVNDGMRVSGSMAWSDTPIVPDNNFNFEYGCHNSYVFDLWDEVAFLQ